MHDVHHTLHKSKPQTVALSRVGGVSLVKFFKDMGAHLRLHPAAGVADHDSGILSIGGQADRYGPAAIGKFEGIGKQIVPNQGQKLRIGADQDLFVNLRLQLNVLLFPDGFKLQQALAELFAQVVFLCGGKDLLVFQFVQSENVGDQIRQTASSVRNGLCI